MTRGIPYIRYRKPTARQARSVHGQLLALRRRVLEWLMELPAPPDGVACDVSVRGNRADIAAFWSRRGKGGQPEPVRTIAVVCALTRRECWAAGINPDSLMLELRNLRRTITVMEEAIRENEPSLKESGTLFEEFAEWNYARSSNAEYHKAVRHWHALEARLCHGTRSERLRSSGCIDEVYVAVPEGTLLADEAMGACGVLEIPVNDAEPVRLATSAKVQLCMLEHRLQLVQGIAVAASAYVCAGNGIKAMRRGGSSPPKKQKKREK